jgi:ABC-type transport system involved in cytochrome bd biosynthesis fused ATPase/permease subunit
MTPLYVGIVVTIVTFAGGMGLLWIGGWLHRKARIERRLRQVGGR